MNLTKHFGLVGLGSVDGPPGQCCGCLLLLSAESNAENNFRYAILIMIACDK